MSYLVTPIFYSTTSFEGNPPKTLLVNRLNYVFVGIKDNKFMYVPIPSSLFSGRRRSNS